MDGAGAGAYRVRSTGYMYMYMCRWTVGDVLPPSTWYIQDPFGFFWDSVTRIVGLRQLGRTDSLVHDLRTLALYSVLRTSILGVQSVILQSIVALTPPCSIFHVR